MPTDSQHNDDSMPTIRTERLILRLADPWSASDCQELIDIFNDRREPDGIVTGVNTIADVQEKFKRNGPKAEQCTLAPPPHGMFFLVYLALGENGSANARSDERKLIGEIGLNFRLEMPYPDLGFAVLASHEGCGYVTEAGRAVLNFWRCTVGVKEIFIGTAPYNVKAQKIAKRLGFVKAGTFDVVFGYPPNEKRETGGMAFVLPGMEWVEGKTLKLTTNANAEDPDQ